MFTQGHVQECPHQDNNSATAIHNPSDQQKESG